MKNDIVKTQINVNNNLIAVLRVGNIDYISLTDLARYKNANDPSFTVKNWLRRVNTIDYIGLWEELTNSNFNLVEFDQIKTEYGRNAFSMSPSQWIKRTNAIGVVSNGGKYSVGTFAHPDIALEFASWIDSSFKLYLIKEFERLKYNESYQNKVEWTVRRSLSKTNYKIHTDAIKENIVPLLTEKQKQFAYADEADAINVALFGMTAKEWREQNPSFNGNIRDYADILHLVVLSNLEVLNAIMIDEGILQSNRIEKLNQTAKKQLILLANEKNISKINETNKEQKLLINE